MNLLQFKKHTASRRPVCKPLRTGEVPVVFPEDIGACESGKLAMISGEVIFADLKANNQYVRILTDATPELIKQWSGYMPQDNDLRLSRFKTDYSGMPTLAIRIWEEKNGEYVRYSDELRNGDKVKCAAIPVKSKGKIYTNLGRDILLVQKSKKKKRRIQYFSDQEED